MFVLTAAGFAMTAVTDQEAWAGIACLASAPLQAAVSWLLLRDYRGILGAMRSTDYPPGIFFAIAPLPGVGSRRQGWHRTAGVWGMLIALVLLVLGVVLVA